MVLSYYAEAQINTPRPSPFAKVTQTVGLTDVTIEYYRPSLKGRKAFGDVVTYGSIWRTGANAGTLVTFSDEVTINNSKVAKGTYMLLTIPGEKEWTVILNKNTKLNGNDPEGYKQEEDVARMTVKPIATMPTVESFTIQVANVKASSASIDLIWENTIVSFPFSVETDSKVMADIKKKMDGPSGGDYYQAASYYLENKKDIQQAKKWIDMACEKGSCSRYWQLRTKALIYAEAGLKNEAKNFIMESIKGAKEDNNLEYIKMNEKSLSDWK